MVPAGELVGLSEVPPPPPPRPAVGPEARARGKLNGEITAHVPYGRRTETLCSRSDNEERGVWNPSCSVIWLL